MNPYEAEDVVLRENRRAELARRLILHGVRTEIVSRLTGLTRNRLATLRRRLMVPDKDRLRGPSRSALSVFLSEPLARAEGAAISALFSVFGIPIEAGALAIPKNIYLPFGELLCETYEAYCACCARTRVELEEIICLRGALAQGERIRLAKCRGCKSLVVIDRYDSSRPACIVVVTPVRRQALVSPIHIRPASHQSLARWPASRLCGSAVLQLVQRKWSSVSQASQLRHMRTQLLAPALRTE